MEKQILTPAQVCEGTDDKYYWKSIVWTFIPIALIGVICSILATPKYGELWGYVCITIFVVLAFYGTKYVRMLIQKSPKFQRAYLISLQTRNAMYISGLEEILQNAQQEILEHGNVGYETTSLKKRAFDFYDSQYGNEDEEKVSDPIGANPIKQALKYIETLKELCISMQSLGLTLDDPFRLSALDVIDPLRTGRFPSDAKTFYCIGDILSCTHAIPILQKELEVFLKKRKQLANEILTYMHRHANTEAQLA